MYTIGIIKANHILEEIFDSSALRSDNYFCQLTGISSESSYNDTLALFNHKLSEPDRGIIFGEPIPNPNDRELINSILSELTHMQIGNLSSEDINLTSSEEINQRVREALDKVISLAMKQEGFSSETIRNNFIAKLMIWCNLYVEDLNFKDETPPKCLFYGPLKKHEVYFLMLLAHIGMDVVYFNPTGDHVLSAIDTEGLCQTEVLGPVQTELVPYKTRVSQGVVVDKVTTYARKASNELEQTLYNDSGVYKPLQFSDGTTVPLILDSVIEDTLTYWNEPARLRPGFKTSGKTVYTPCFFTKINGVYTEINEYYDLVQKLRSAKHCLFYETPHFSGGLNQNLNQSRPVQYHNVQFANSHQPNRSSNTELASNFNQQDMYSLAFCLNPDQTIKRDQVKTHALYRRMLSLRTDLQEFLFNKLEETFAADNCSFFKFPVTDKERVRLMAALFTADERLLNLIDSYDFTSDIPKIVLYINSREQFTEDDALLLGLLRQIGLDIIVLAPNGANNLELVISEKFINQVKLEEFAYDLPLKSPGKIKKGSFFSKLFR